MRKDTAEIIVQAFQSVGSLIVLLKLVNVVKDAFTKLAESDRKRVRDSFQMRSLEYQYQYQQGSPPSFIQPLFVHHDSLPTREIYSLRWKLIGHRINVETLRRLLNILPGTVSEIKFAQLTESASEIYHVYDPYIDCSKHIYSEWIVLRHSTRNWIAYVPIVPFQKDIDVEFTSVHENNFWYNCGINELLLLNYKRYRAILKIQRCKQMLNWLDKPITDDGKVGIRCRLGWKNVQNMNSPPVSAIL